TWAKRSSRCGCRRCAASWKTALPGWTAAVRSRNWWRSARSAWRSSRRIVRRMRGRWRRPWPGCGRQPRSGRGGGGRGEDAGGRAELERVRGEGEKGGSEAGALERRKRRRLALAAAAVLATGVVGGLSAVLAVQRQANADLTATNDELGKEKAKVQAKNAELAD